MLKVENTTPINVIVNYDGYDGYEELIILPAGTKREVAEEVFMNDYYLERPHSMYDCTGKTFTSDYEIFVHREATLIIHWVSVDI